MESTMGCHANRNMMVHMKSLFLTVAFIALCKVDRAMEPYLELVISYLLPHFALWT